VHQRQRAAEHIGRCSDLADWSEELEQAVEAICPGIVKTRAWASSLS
jgi:hypothetical protein